MSDACWEFLGTKRNAMGHGSLSVHNRPVHAHRLAYALHRGPIPSGRSVCHHCDNPACVRPEHLFLGTQQDNVNDMLGKGRSVPPPIKRGLANSNAKLTEAQVAEIRRRWATDPTDQRALAREFGCSQSTIWRLVHGVTRDPGAAT